MKCVICDEGHATGTLRLCTSCVHSYNVEVTSYAGALQWAGRRARSFERQRATLPPKAPDSQPGTQSETTSRTPGATSGAEHPSPEVGASPTPGQPGTPGENPLDDGAQVQGAGHQGEVSEAELLAGYALLAMFG